VTLTSLVDPCTETGAARAAPQDATPPPRLDDTSTVTPAIAPSPEEQEAALVGAFAEQLVGMLALATTLLTIELGRRFGLYRALREHGPMTATALARTTGVRTALRPRVARAAGAAGILAAARSRELTPSARASRCPRTTSPVLVDETHPATPRPSPGLLAGVRPRVPRGRRRLPAGRGVAFEEYGAGAPPGPRRAEPPGLHARDAGLGRDAARPRRRARTRRASSSTPAAARAGRRSPSRRRSRPHVSSASTSTAPRSTRRASTPSPPASPTGSCSSSATRATRPPSATRRSGQGVHDGPRRIPHDGCARAGLRPRHGLRGAARHGPTGGRTRRVPVALRPGGTILVADERVADEFHADAEPWSACSTR
jgi:hypothetical protein